MISPKSRQHKEKRVSYKRRKHKNKQFYNSKAWRDTREAYLRDYQQKLFKYIPRGAWDNVGLDIHQISYILSLGFLPCETCLRLYAAEAYDKVEPGKELDHIEPVNPENALERILISLEAPYNGPITIDYKYGDPLNFDNLQYLCKRHHAKKSQRER